jgi:quercetin dioxygenase-like cupin family protein
METTMGTAGPAREVAIARPDDPALTHLAVVGDTYTVLLSGDQTDGRFAMLDMLIPPGGGPPPHFHDFEECFRVLEGSIEVRVGDAPPLVLDQGDSANIPANAPHSFRNAAEVEARLLCTVVPRGLRSSSPSSATRSPRAPHRPGAQRRRARERLRIAMAKAPEFGMGFVPPPSGPES